MGLHCGKPRRSGNAAANRRAPQVRAYDKNERAKVLAASETSSYPYLPALLKVLGMTGARRSEAIGIAVPDIDFDTRTITIRRTIVQVGKESSCGRASAKA